MTLVHLLRRVPLTAWCMLATLVVVAGLGIGLSAAISSVVHEQASAQASAQARRSAEAAARLVQHTMLDPAAARGVTDLDRARLDAVVEESDLRSLRIWGLEDRVLYDSLDRLRGAEGAEALLAVQVPLHTGAPGTVVGAVEVALSYDAAAQRSAQAARRITELLVCGLAALWGVLWWLCLRVTRRLQRSAAQEHDLARTDELTGLPNRRALLAGLDEAFAAGTPVALLLLDLDRFKEVNDTLGHHVGDQLLHQVGQRLVASVGEAGTVVRLGGDEFAVQLHGVGDPVEAAAVSDRLVGELERPFALSDLQVGIGTSIGVAVAPQDAAAPAELLQRADVAMYAAKQRSGGTAVYDPAQDSHSPDRLALLSELRTGLAAGELWLAYQPIWDLQTSGACVAVEALLRWDSPKRGPVPPSDFVPLCEKSNLVRDLTRFVLDEAIGQCRAWEDEGTRLNLAVNLSASNLGEADLPELLAGLLTRHGLSPDRVVLEVTESAVIPDPEGAAAVLRRLVDLGLEIALDDFGTGWSSMSRLLELPIAALKVDRSFVADLPHGPGAAVVQATTGLAHDLGMFVVAEGIETHEQLARTVELGCDIGQGYLLSRPLRPADVPAAAQRRLQHWLAVPAQRAP